MKKVLLILLLVVSMLVAGCSDNNSDQQVSSQEPQDQATGAQQQRLIRTPVAAQTPAPIQQQIISSTSLGTLCGELVTCGDLPASSGVAAIPSTRCQELNRMTIRHDRSVLQCFKDSYTGTTDRMENWNIEYIKVMCSKGVGSRGYCAKYGATLGERQSI